MGASAAENSTSDMVSEVTTSTGDTVSEASIEVDVNKASVEVDTNGVAPDSPATNANANSVVPVSADTTANAGTTDLCANANSTTKLESFIDEVCGESHLRVEDDFGGGFVRLRTSEAERRQAAHDIRSTEDAVIELLRNARDAGAHNIFLAMTRNGKMRKLVIIDDGSGVPKSMRTRIFEPRVTSKLDTMHLDKWGVHGRGMALYSIKVNAETACILSSFEGGGSAFLVESDLSKLPEKTDQSTFPSFEFTQSGTYAMRGPRNVARTVCEFSLEAKNSCAVYFGSATDIAATLWAFGQSCAGAAELAGCANIGEIERLPICKRLAWAHTPAEFSFIARELGLEMSERSARRIMDGTIAPLMSMLDKMRECGFSKDGEAFGQACEKTDVKANTKTSVNQHDKERSKKGAGSGQAGANSTGSKNSFNSKREFFDARGLKLAEEDIEVIKEKTREILADLAPRYYFNSKVEPQVRIQGNAIKISIPVEKMR